MLNAPPSNPQRTPQRVERGKDPRSSALGFPPTAPQFPGPHGLSPGYPWRGRGWHGGTGETRGGHGGDRGRRRGAGTAPGQERAREGSGGVGGVGRRLPAPSGRETVPQPPLRAARGRTEGDAPGPAPPCRGADSPAPEQTVPGTAARSDGAVPPPAPGEEGSQQPPVGPTLPRPGRPTRGTGGMRRGMYPSPTRPDLWVAWDFLSRCEGGDEVMVMGTLPDVSRLAGGCASSC